MKARIFIFMFVVLVIPYFVEAACEPSIPGDVSGDCNVNFNDFVILAADWLIHPNDCPPNFPTGDLNFDCSTDSLDLAQMAVHWLKSCRAQIPADLSGDCKVDFNDFAMMATDWLQGSDIEAETMWVAQYNGPGSYPAGGRAIVVDSNDNIYIAGGSWSTDSITSCDYVTIKYSPDSNQPVWVARYNGRADSYDAAGAIAVDSNGNVYVTGVSDNGTNYDYLTIKYSPDSSQPVWVARYNGPGNKLDHGEAIAVDSNDNVYVTGGSWGADTAYDYATIKYSADSNEPVWVARYNGTGNWCDFGNAIAVDSNDSIYVTGSSWGAGTESDYATVKYSPDSNQPVWVAGYNGPPGSSSDVAYAITVDSKDNIYVTGYSTGSGTDQDYATIKYTPDSNQPVWVARYDGPGSGNDWAEAIAVDSEDNIYVTGVSYSDRFYDYTTIKYSADSNEAVWVGRYTGPGNNSDKARAIAVDSEDNVYVTGQSYSGTSTDYLTIKYTADSKEAVWVARYNGPADIGDHAYAIAVDRSDNVYVTGTNNHEPMETANCATIKYSAGHICSMELGGDVNGDCEVDIFDLGELCQSWLEGI